MHLYLAMIYCTQVTDIDGHGKLSGGSSTLYAHSSQKAMSLPSSPHEFRIQTPERSGTPRVSEETVSTWHRVLGSPMFQNNPLLPYEEWNIDYSELTVGTRVGIGEHRC